MRDYRIVKFFQRMIALADRECSQCGEQCISEGEIYWRDKTGANFCTPCKEYDQEHGVSEGPPI
jgi:formylmethanofuran dehydrogenase subunit E